MTKKTNCRNQKDNFDNILNFQNEELREENRQLKLNVDYMEDLIDRIGKIICEFNKKIKENFIKIYLQNLDKHFQEFEDYELLDYTPKEYHIDSEDYITKLLSQSNDLMTLMLNFVLEEVETIKDRKDERKDEVIVPILMNIILMVVKANKVMFLRFKKMEDIINGSYELAKKNEEMINTAIGSMHKFIELEENKKLIEEADSYIKKQPYLNKIILENGGSFENFIKEIFKSDIKFDAGKYENEFII